MPQEQLDALMKATVEKHLAGEFGHAEDSMEAYLYATGGRNVTGNLISMNAGALLDRTL
jgi:glucose/arabinose dehydrogenase